MRALFFSVSNPPNESASLEALSLYCRRVKWSNENVAVVVGGRSHFHARRSNETKLSHGTIRIRKIRGPGAVDLAAPGELVRSDGNTK